MPDVVELIGYAASGLIVVSLMMSSLLRLRLVNLTGSVVFAIYALLIGSLPVLLTNLAITVINSAHLRRMWRDRAHDAYFEVIDVEPTSSVLRRFVEFHADDITRFQPEFDGLRGEHVAWMVLRDAVPVGAVLATWTGQTSVHLDLDYVTEAHRDFTPGTVLFGTTGAFERQGVSHVTTRGATPAHERYLERMGFRRADGVWVRELA